MNPRPLCAGLFFPLFTIIKGLAAVFLPSRFRLPGPPASALPHCNSLSSIPRLFPLRPCTWRLLPQYTRVCIASYAHTVAEEKRTEQLGPLAKQAGPKGFQKGILYYAARRDRSLLCLYGVCLYLDVLHGPRVVLLLKVVMAYGYRSLFSRFLESSLYIYIHKTHQSKRSRHSWDRRYSAQSRRN